MNIASASETKLSTRTTRQTRPRAMVSAYTHLRSHNVARADATFAPYTEPLVQKVRKAEEKARPTSVRPTPGPSRSASLAPLASVALPPPSDHPDPLDGLTPIQRKLHQQRFAKVRSIVPVPSSCANRTLSAD